MTFPREGARPLIALATALLISTASAAPESPKPVELSGEERAALDSIRASTIMPTIRFLASEELEGREAGQRGCDVAAQYLVSRMQAAGLEAGTKEGFMQGFDLRWRTLAPEVELTLERKGSGATERRTMEVRKDFAPLSFSEQGTVEAPIVFAGYGIESAADSWNDYAALGPGGARGKIVLVFRHEPDEFGQASPSRFEGADMSLASSLRQKVRNAVKHGAVGLILVDDPINHEVKENPSTSWRTLTADERAKPADDDVRFRGRPDTRDAAKPLGIVAMHASQELLRWLAPDRDWKALQADLDAGNRVQQSFPSVTVKMVHRAETSTRRTSNIIGLLRGSDPVLSKEYVLLGGHYDHIGKEDKTEEVNNGADDNASGTSTVVAVAEAMSQLPVRPKRSLIFALWSAEELGLLGSDWFVHHPPVELDKIVAAINLDMVGRNEEKQISVVGRTESPDMTALFDRFAPEVGFELNDDAGAGASRSDNASMWQAGVPCVSLFSGTHDDYHDVGDDASKIVPGKVERAARLSFLVAREIAENRATPKALEVPKGPWDPIAPASRVVDKSAATTAAAVAAKKKGVAR